MAATSALCPVTMVRQYPLLPSVNTRMSAYSTPVRLELPNGTRPGAMMYAPAAVAVENTASMPHMSPDPEG